MLRPGACSKGGIWSCWSVLGRWSATLRNKGRGREACSAWRRECSVEILLVVAFQYVEGAYNQEVGQLFIWTDSDRIQRNDFKLKEGILMLGGNILFRR